MDNITKNLVRTACVVAVIAGCYLCGVTYWNNLADMDKCRWHLSDDTCLALSLNNKDWRYYDPEGDKVLANEMNSTYVDPGNLDAALAERAVYDNLEADTSPEAEAIRDIDKASAGVDSAMANAGM
jgi:hypothetical protein